MVASKSITRSDITRLILAAKRRDPSMTDADLWKRICGGDRDLSALVGDVLNAMAEGEQ